MVLFTLQRALAHLGSNAHRDPLGLGRSRRIARSGTTERVRDILRAGGIDCETHLVNPTALERFEDVGSPHALGRDEAGLEVQSFVLSDHLVSLSDERFL